MESTTIQQPNQKKKRPVLLVILLMCVAIAAGAAVAFALSLRESEPQPESAPKIGYSTGTVIMEGSGPVKLTPPDNITLEYKRVATSQDGKTFKCQIANAKENQFDMYIDMYTDSALTDEIFLSELFRPGTGFEEITLNRTLDKGLHTVYLVFTQVEDDQSTMHNQMVVTYDLLVE